MLRHTQIAGHGDEVELLVFMRTKTNNPSQVRCYQKSYTLIKKKNQFHWLFKSWSTHNCEHLCLNKYKLQLSLNLNTPEPFIGWRVRVDLLYMYILQQIMHKRSKGIYSVKHGDKKEQYIFPFLKINFGVNKLFQIKIIFRFLIAFCDECNWLS